MNAAQSNNLPRLKEILDANPERVLFSFTPFILADSIHNSETFS